MTERWIIGADGSDESIAARRWAVQQAAGRAVQLEPVTVVPNRFGRHLLANLARRWHDRRDQSDTATADDDTVTIVHGSPGRALVDASADASLLVVGRHGAGGGWRNTLGSVSRYCVTHSSAPTAVVPVDAPDRAVSRIVVGFDGSANGRAALEWALSFARGGGVDVDVRALIAVEVAPWLQEDLVHVRLGDEVEAERDRLLGLLAQADPDGRSVPDVVVRGAKPALAGAADSADLVVVGARGTGPMVGLGSASTWLLDASPCPVVVVPDPGVR